MTDRKQSMAPVMSVPYGRPMLCEHPHIGWRLVYRAIDVHDNKFGNRWNHYQWLEEARCCMTCGKEINEY